MRSAPEELPYDASGNTYILIPTKTLPIVQPFLDAASATGTTALVKPVVDLISPTLRVLIDLAMTALPTPAPIPTLSPLPFNPATFNPVQLATEAGECRSGGILSLTDDLSAPTAANPNETHPPTGPDAFRRAGRGICAYGRGAPTEGHHVSRTRCTE